MTALPHETRKALLARVEALEGRVRQLEAERADGAAAAGGEPRRTVSGSYGALVDRLDQGFCVIQVRFDPGGRAVDYRFLEVNAAFEEQTGIARALGRWMREIAPEHEEHWFRIYGDVARTGEEARFRHAAAELQRFFDVHAFRVGEPGEHKVGVLFKDISREKQAEEALRESKERLQAAVEGGDLGIWDLDLTTGIAVRSARHDAIWGHPEPLLEWSLEAAMAQVHPDDRPLIEAAYDAGIRTGALSHENRIVWPDGSIHWIAAAGRFRYDEEGRPLRVTGVVADVTERKRAEGDLRMAVEAAERASRAKTQFLAVTSHELRTPLNAIVGYHDLLAMGLRGPLSAGQAEFMERIKQSANDLLRIIDDILSVARVEARTESLDLEAAELRGVAERAAELLRPRVDEKGLVLRMELPDRPVALTTDVQKLLQILLNLLGNAIRFTAAGEVGLSVRPGGDGTGAIVTEVHDTGSGIAEEHHEWIFEPFAQLDPFNTRTHRGTGLGLSIARSYARLLGGDLTVRSEPGSGSTFTLVLPREGPGAAGDGAA